MLTMRCPGGLRGAWLQPPLGGGCPFPVLKAASALVLTPRSAWGPRCDQGPQPYVSQREVAQPAQRAP